MRKRGIVTGLAVLYILVFGIVSLAAAEKWENIGRENLDITAVLISPDDNRIIYAGSGSGILKTEDGGESWRSIFSLKGKDRKVNFLCFDPKDKNSLYAATSIGLFYSRDQGNNWKRVFKGKSYLERDCRFVVILPQEIYLGTKIALFISQDKGRSWHKDLRWKGSSEELVDAEEEEQEHSYVNLNHIAASPVNPNYIYLATNSGVYESQNRGESWEALSSYGLLDKSVEFLLISNRSEIYAVSDSGIFIYQGQRWQELSLRLAAGEIRGLALDNQGNLYAACEKGLFKTQLKYTQDNSENIITALYCENEPSVNKVQQVAIEYAEVEPDKIKEWRSKAKMKAILPKLTVGIDRSENTNYEIYTSATTRYVYEGPDDKSGGWDVTLSWDFGELIWNNDQTSIDVRSKLMVELRDDILDEVTRLYFERLRLKLELDNLSIEERKKRFEKELKIQELTAMLDGATGGFFSQHLK